jgi:hypothetical protein
MTPLVLGLLVGALLSLGAGASSNVPLPDVGLCFDEKEDYATH